RKVSSPQNLSTKRSIDGPTTSLLLRGGMIVTQDAGRSLVSGDVLVEDGRIAACCRVDRSAAEVIDCNGCAVLPGLINLHNHAPNTLLRGVADDVPLEEMLPMAAAIDAKLTRRDVQIGALLACVEMIRSGTTSFHDLFYWEDEVARAVRESGIRGFLSWVTLDESKTTQHGSPLKNAEKIGFLGPDLTAAHCVWITINEVRTLARHGVSVAHCPVSNMKLASGGVAPVPEMLREGIVVGLGTDSPISNNAMDMFADMKIAALLHKAARWDARAMPAQV